MSFQPVLPFGGQAGWLFLARTRDTQQAAFDTSAPIARATDDFEARIGSIRSAQELVSDRRLLSVALGAFGLDDDINNRFFLQKVLEGGVNNPESLANRLADPRYRDLSRAFGFGDLDPPRTVLSDFGAEITSAYRTRQFEIAVGRQDETIRLALGLERALGQIAATDTTDNGRWFAVMGQPPVRKVFEAALGLPASFGALDLDRQLSVFRERSASVLGASEIKDLATPEKQADLTRLFLLRNDIGAGPAAVAGSAALTLLQSAASRWGRAF